MSDIFDELDERTKEPSAGNYAPWWDVDEEGSHLRGVVVEVHDAPDKYTDVGEIPDPMFTVVSIGNCDFEKGVGRTTKTHTRLLQGLDGVKIGDVVNLKYQGLEKTDNGNAANTYEVGHIPEDEWKELDGADEIEDVVDDWDGVTGDNRSGEPVGAGGGNSGGGSSGNDDSGSDGETSELEEAVDFVQDLVSMQNGEMPYDQVEKMVLDVREFDVDLETVLTAAGYEKDGDQVVSA